MRYLTSTIVIAGFMGALLAGADSACAHPDMETPLFRDLPQSEEGRVAQALTVFACPCGPAGKGKLISPSCDCKAAVEDRAMLKEGVTSASEKDIKSGKAVLEAILDAIESEPRLRRSIKFNQKDFDHLWDTTRSVCPAELLKVYRIGPISCRIRAIWGLRFKALLALGYSTEEIFESYVLEVNAGLPEDKQYAAHELLYVPAGNVAITLPIVAGLIAFLGLRLVKRRRLKKKEKAQHGKPVSGSKSGDLTEAEKELLREELEDSLEA